GGHVTMRAGLSTGSAGVKLTTDGDGAITFLGLGNGSDEDLTLNLDDTADTGVISSSTGLNSITFSGIGATFGGAVTFSSTTTFQANDIADSEVSDTLTSSIFIGSGST